MAEFGVGSDYKTIITFTADGAVIDASGAYMTIDYELEFYTTSLRKKKVASKIGNTLTNCSYINDDGEIKLVVAIDSVEWGAGEVICKASKVYGDTRFPDLKRTVVSYIETGDEYVQ
jgi:hypothetical protein